MQRDQKKATEIKTKTKNKKQSKKKKINNNKNLNEIKKNPRYIYSCFQRQLLFQLNI